MKTFRNTLTKLASKIGSGNEEESAEYDSKNEVKNDTKTSPFNEVFTQPQTQKSVWGLHDDGSNDFISSPTTFQQPYWPSTPDPPLPTPDPSNSLPTPNMVDLPPALTSNPMGDEAQHLFSIGSYEESPGTHDAAPRQNDNEMTNDKITNGKEDGTAVVDSKTWLTSFPQSVTSASPFFNDETRPSFISSALSHASPATIKQSFAKLFPCLLPPELSNDQLLRLACPTVLDANPLIRPQPFHYRSNHSPPLLGLFVVGFHHIHGPTIEFSWPPRIDTAYSDNNGSDISPKSWDSGGAVDSNKPAPDPPTPDPSTPDLLPTPDPALATCCADELTESTRIATSRLSIEIRSTENVNEMIRPILQYLPFLALPDASHRMLSDFVYFVLPLPNGRQVFGVSCYRRVPVSELEYRDNGMTRGHVQKAVCILSQLPFFGPIQSRLDAITLEYFAQRDFRNTSILSTFYDEFNSSIEWESTPYSTLCFKLESDLPSITSLLKPRRIIMLVKAILLELKIVVYSISAAKASSAVLQLVSFLPNQLSLNTTWDGFLSKKEREQFCFPLDLLQGTLFPYLSLQLLETIAMRKSFLVGVTNRVLLAHPILKPDVIVDLETCRVEVATKEIEHSLSVTPHDYRLIKNRLHVSKSSNSSAIAHRSVFSGTGIDSSSPKEEELRLDSPSEFGGHSAALEEDKSTPNGISDDESVSSKRTHRKPDTKSRFKVSWRSIKSDHSDKKSKTFEPAEPITPPTLQVEEEDLSLTSQTKQPEFSRRGSTTTRTRRPFASWWSRGGGHHEAEPQTSRVIAPKLPRGFSDSNFDQQFKTDRLVDSPKDFPSQSEIDMNEVMRELWGNYLETLLRLVAFAAGPERSLVSLRRLMEEKVVGLRDFGAEFMKAWTSTHSCNLWLKSHNLPILPRFTKPPRIGWASYRYPNGDEFSGEFLHGLRHGHGVYLSHTGIQYAGTWWADQRHGKGTLINQSLGIVYSGDWIQNKKYGVGELVSKKECYWGTFMNNKFHGQGFYVDSNGNRFDGQFVEGRLDGVGKLRRANGEVSAGEWKAGKLCGTGHRFYRDGRSFSGFFVNNLPHGSGVMTFPDGTKFDGNWKEGKRHGGGILTFDVSIFPSSEISDESSMTSQSLLPLSRRSKGVHRNWNEGVLMEETKNQETKNEETKNEETKNEETKNEEKTNEEKKFEKMLQSAVMTIEGEWEDDIPLAIPGIVWTIHFPTLNKYAGELTFNAEGIAPSFYLSPPVLHEIETPSIETAQLESLLMDLRNLDDETPETQRESSRHSSHARKRHSLDFSMSQFLSLHPTMPVTLNPNVLASGSGISKKSNGELYDGEWQLGMRHGYGECVWSDGGRYKGHWAYGLAHGSGTVVTGDGRVVSGLFKKGMLSNTTEELQCIALSTPIDGDETEMPEYPKPEDLEDSPELWQRFNAFHAWPIDTSPYFKSSKVPDIVKQQVSTYRRKNVARTAIHSSHLRSPRRSLPHSFPNG